jgi:outer membrane receptor protein involved in Fe transport
LAAALLVFVALNLADSSAAAPTGLLTGVVADRTGSLLVGAEVALLTRADTEVARTATGPTGRFRFEGLADASYVLDVRMPGFAPARRIVHVAPGELETLRIALELAPQVEAVTVTPVRGDVRRVQDVPEATTVTGADVLSHRSYTTFPQALREEPGVSVQQTSTSQGSPFVRGLTGQYVVNYVDGVRFNNSTFRPGANQYVALIEPQFVDRVEIVRGPTSTQYGSDALGGAINVISQPGQRLSPSARAGAMVSGFFGAADVSGGGGVEASLSGSRWALTGGGTWRRMQDLRTGGGIDSRSVATRLLGLPSSVLGKRLDETGYTQSGVSGRLVWLPSAAEAVTVSYLRGKQSGASRYDQLNGGVGNLIAGFDPQILDFALARYERIGAGPFDSVSATVSYNGQTDDRSSQSVNNAKKGLLSPVTKEHNRTNVFGFQGQAAMDAGARHRLAFGAELYAEGVDSERNDFSYNAASAGFTDATDVRARFPDNAAYRTVAVFAQDGWTIVDNRLVATLGLRYSNFRYTQTPDGNPSSSTEPSVPGYATSFGDGTWNAGLVWTASEYADLTARVGRGFRAPNVNDFGSIGLSGVGFEVSPDEGKRVGGQAAVMGTLADLRLVADLLPETLLGYEASVRLRARGLRATMSAFSSDLEDFIERRTLLMEPGAVGSQIGGQPIIRQDPSGAVYTALASTPVYVRANSGRVRLSGVEGVVSWSLPRGLQAAGNVSYVRGEDLTTGLPPNLENGVPPLHGYAGLTWTPGTRWWGEVYSQFAARQGRLSANDMAQPRIGATRTASAVRDYFNNGAVAAGLVRNSVLLATGENVNQVIARVIGPDLSAAVPLYEYNPAFATLNLRGGWKLGKATSFTVILENLLDANYRVMGSGVDGPGFNLVIRFATAVF